MCIRDRRYGGSLAGVRVSVLLWAGCYNTVMTSDKFTMLFGNLVPALSMLLVMVLRLIPSYFRKMRQITGSRESIGKGSRTDTYAHRLTEEMCIRDRERTLLSVELMACAWVMAS